MNTKATTIPKQAALNPGEDFYFLRQEGIGFIQQMGSQYWTDYNSHDPGITLLEAMCYAYTDFNHRCSWEIKDLLSPAEESSDPQHPFPQQAFFSAAEILPVNPWTTDDYRRLLIDLDDVRNAWVICKECACTAPFYAWCEADQTQLVWHLPEELKTPYLEVDPRGFYDVLIELEADPQLGDLNDHKLEYRQRYVDDQEQFHELVLELRFADWSLHHATAWAEFLQANTQVDISVKAIGATADFNLLDLADADQRNRYLQRHTQHLLYVTFTLQLQPSALSVDLPAASLRLLSDRSTLAQLSVEDLLSLLVERNQVDFIGRYQHKSRLTQQAIKASKRALHTHRNLDEDFCSIRGIDVEDIAVCADIEVSADADIDRVQAEIWFALERYLNPGVPFYSLQELLKAGWPVEEIFSGPPLSQGFIKDSDLKNSELRGMLRTSDIVHQLMEIEGVIAVNQLRLSKYDAFGRLIAGAADPQWNGDLSQPIFDPTKTSAAWLLFLSVAHLPRLYHNLSRFLFYKNGLPFRARYDEARDTLIQLRGAAERPKLPNSASDLPIPVGRYRDAQAYVPFQASLPATYGLGHGELPAHASAQRRAQAKQLKAYLMAFEQLLANAHAQLGQCAQLFSLDETLTQTYFTQLLSAEQIAELDEIINELDQDSLNRLVESPAVFLQRRNQFLDHLLARFSEQFSEHALLLTDLEGKQIALEHLISTKLALLKAYPVLSRDRGRAFDYQIDPCADDNRCGLAARITALLGAQSLDFIVVEHLLLRPKFPGDALYPVCVEGACHTCGEEDPYSFRISLVMPGWIEPYASHLNLRGFAERTIQQELPAHLLGKICWVDNAGFNPDPCAAVIDQIAELLLTQGHLADNSRPSEEQACACAQAIYTLFSEHFSAWFADKTLLYFHPVALNTALSQLFDALDPGSVNCAVDLSDAALWLRIRNALLEYFHDIALYGWQYERFQQAWCHWLELNAGFDWSEERLHERVQALLSSKLLNPDKEADIQARLCKLTVAILSRFGDDFYHWLHQGLQAGLAADELDFNSFNPQVIVLSNEFSFAADTLQALTQFLRQRYARYVEVSYALQILVNLLSALRNIYPPATLHDCDEGNDQNPVRLGQTALGR